MMIQLPEGKSVTDCKYIYYLERFSIYACNHPDTHCTISCDYFIKGNEKDCVRYQSRNNKKNDLIEECKYCKAFNEEKNIIRISELDIHGSSYLCNCPIIFCPKCGSLLKRYKEINELIPESVMIHEKYYALNKRCKNKNEVLI